MPLERAGEVAAVASEIDRAERLVFELIGQGMTLREARKQAGYHGLQSRRKQ